jgi:hypothetical protein
LVLGIALFSIVGGYKLFKPTEDVKTRANQAAITKLNLLQQGLAREEVEKSFTRLPEVTTSSITWYADPSGLRIGVPYDSYQGAGNPQNRISGFIIVQRNAVKE